MSKSIKSIKLILSCFVFTIGAVLFLPLGMLISPAKYGLGIMRNVERYIDEAEAIGLCSKEEADDLRRDLNL